MPRVLCAEMGRSWMDEASRPGNVRLKIKIRKMPPSLRVGHELPRRLCQRRLAHSARRGAQRVRLENHARQGPVRSERGHIPAQIPRHPMAKRVYEGFFGGCGSRKACEILHTSYVGRKKFN